MLGSAVVVAGGATGPSGNLLGMGLALLNVVLFAVFFLVSKASRTDLGTLPFLGGALTVAALLVSAYVPGRRRAGAEVPRARTCCSQGSWRPAPGSSGTWS